MAKVSPRVAWISIAPVKGLALVPLEEAHLGRGGVGGDRAFPLVDRDGKLVNGKRLGRLMLVRPEVSGDRLALRFPDDSVVDGRLETRDSVVSNFYRGLVVRLSC